MITKNDYDKAQAELKKLSEKEKMEKEFYDIAQRKFNDIYYEAERKIRQEKYDAEKILSTKSEEFMKLISKEAEPYREIGGQFKRILSFIRVMMKENKSLDFEVYKFDYPRDEKGEVIRTDNQHYPEKEKIFYPVIATIKKNDFISLKAFIVDNGKPKNKYSLIVAGSSLFSSVIDLPRTYISGVHTNYENILHCLKDAPTEKELYDYFAKTIIMKNFLIEHDKAETEYKEVEEKTKEDKTYILAYWEDEKRYYENNYSGGTETEEYKKVLEKIRELQG